MALIKCPECGNETSDQAPACMQCRAPIIIKKNKSEANQDKKSFFQLTQSERKHYPIFVRVFALIGLIICVIFSLFGCALCFTVVGIIPGGFIWIVGMIAGGACLYFML